MKEQGVHVISVDEKTGMQALEKKAETPMQPDQVARQDYEYVRHGTQCMIANLEVATGQILKPTVQQTRKEEDFVEHIKRTIETDPESQWIFIVDQLNIHKSEGLVKFVSEHCELNDELGIKGKKGILHSMKTRMAYLSNENHKVRFVYTPKHASWLNQIECWFSLISRHLLKRLSVVSIEQLRSMIFKYIEYYNRVLAKPFKWLYRGKTK